MAPAARLPARLLLAVAALATLGALSLWLRAPSLRFAAWNVDEAIHAAVARTLLDGGVLYRDAIDQRTPLTYGVMAAIFSLTGPNNLFAAHVVVALVVAATGGLLLLAGRRMAGTGAGVWAALLYVVLSTGMLYQGDANAFVTEWFVALGSSAAAAWFWSRGGAAGASGAGLLLALSALAKQPGAADLAGPLAVLAWAGSADDGRRNRLVRAGWLLGGFGLPLLLVGAYYAARGALGDLVFYTWTYNWRYYGPEVGTADRILSGLRPLQLLANFSPLLAGIAAAAAVAGLRRLLGRPGEGRPAALYLLAWAAGALLAAASGGRGFDHYSIQFLPPLALGTGWLLAALTRVAARPGGSWPVRLLAGTLPFLLVLTLGSATLRARSRTLPVDPSWRAARYIAAHTAPGARLFVWGYHPDLYLFSDRRPASRFVYASFLTGLIPWTNTAPERDTAYAVVPGAMDTLLHDLESSRPAFIVDCSAGPNRHWDKYPLERFPRLAGWIAERYVPVESGQFLPQGFRLLAARDSFVPPAPLPPEPAAGRAGEVSLFLSPLPDTATTPVRVHAADPAGRLSRLELWLDGRKLDGVTLAPGRELTLEFPVRFQDHPGRHRWQAVARAADGAVWRSETQETDASGGLPRPQLDAFLLATSAGPQAAVAGVAPFGASAGIEDGHAVLFAHAPSRLRFALPPGSIAVSGAMGFRPGAYAPENAHPTDGAEFRVETVTAAGDRALVLRRLLRPASEPGDRGLLAFRATLPAGAAGWIEFSILPGPAGDPSSDWTLWADLRLENSR